MLVKSYFAAAGGFEEAEVIKGVALPDGSFGPLQRLRLAAEQLLSGGGGPDPFFAVVAHKSSSSIGMDAH